MNKEPRYIDYLSLLTHLLWCYDHRNVGARQRGDRSHDNNGAWLVRSGWAEVHHDKRVTKAYPGQWLIVKPVQRLQRFGPGTELLSISFEAKWPDGKRLLDDGLSVVLDAAEHPKLEESARPMIKRMKRVNPDLWDVRKQQIDCINFLELQGLLTRWLSVLVEVLATKNVLPSRSEPVDNRILRAVRSIESRPLHEALDLNALANIVGVSRVHLSRLFRQQLGVTPYAYWDKLRVEYACRRLKMPDVRPLEVAYELGFKYLSHFSRWFKSHTGISPRNYAAG